MESEPENTRYKSIVEKKLQKNKGFLEYTVGQGLHTKALNSKVFKEKGNPKFYQVITVKRTKFNMEAVAKVYETKKESIDREVFINEVRAENDVEANIEIGKNCFMLEVYDYNWFSTIYETYLYNLEEIYELWSGRGNVRKLKQETTDFMKDNNLFTTGGCTTAFFQKLMKHTLEFLEFLNIRGWGYGGIHPHNIVIVDAECTIKFKGMKCVDCDEKSGRIISLDIKYFVLLVRFCAHNGGRDFYSEIDDNTLLDEAKHFLSICTPQNGKYHDCWSYYYNGFKSNRMEIIKHPLFWDAEMCLNYFLQTHNLLVACGFATSAVVSRASQTFQQNFRQRFSPNSKVLSLDKQLNSLNIIPTVAMKKTTSISVVDDIIRWIRNMEGHSPDGLQGGASNLGNLGSRPINCWSNLRVMYPGLITGVHEIMLRHSKELSPSFPDYWNKFYPCA